MRAKRRAHKAGAVCLTLAAILLPLPSSALETPDTGTRGDDIVRIQTRLYDLGYSLVPPTGVWRISDDRALSAYEAANADFEPGLFAPDANPVSIDPEPAAQPSGDIYGGLMPWSEAKMRLTAGQSYTITDYQSGIIIRLQYLGGEGYAVLRPALAWDNATMESMFSDVMHMEARPVVITIDGMLVAAALRIDPFANDSTGFSRVKLYFSGSFSGLGGLPDSDCDAAVQQAATQN